MNTEKERILFVMRFVNTDLEGLREGAWLDLQRDVLDYVRWPHVRQKQVTRDVLKPLQHEIATVLREYTQPTGERDENKMAFFIALPPGHMKLTLGPAHTHAALEGGSLPDTFKLAATFTIAVMEDGLVRQCQAAGCGRIFYAEHGRQRYHDALCAKRENMRIIRARQRSAKKHARRS